MGFRMIVIKARGARDVRALRRLANKLSAGTVSLTETAELNRPDAVSASGRRGHNPGVTILPRAALSPQTQAAIAELRPVEMEQNGEYDLA